MISRFKVLNWMVLDTWNGLLNSWMFDEIGLMKILMMFRIRINLMEWIDVLIEYIQVKNGLDGMYRWIDW